MKSEKIYLNDLLQAISSESNQNKTIIENFLKSLFTEIEEGLKKDKLVKINGFGTFKLQWNEARKSVNVNTGEEILIEGYNKVTFIPDNNLKNEINEPFAHLETIKLDVENNEEKLEIKKEKNIGSVKSEEITVIKELLSDIGEMDKKENIEEGNFQEIKTPNSLIENKKVNELLNEINNLQQNINLKNNTMNSKPKEISTKPNDVKISKEKTPKNKEGNWKIIGISICVICSIAILLCFLFFNKDEKVVIEDEEVIIEQVVEPVKLEPTIFELPREYTEFITTEYLPKGSRLAWLSTKYYGTQEFWVYIYEANMEVVDDPNYIFVNTKIRVPKLPAELIDQDNPACIEYALSLKEKYVK